MRGTIKKDINFQFGMLLDSMQQQKNIKDNFLNLLCALPCVDLRHKGSDKRAQDIRAQTQGHKNIRAQRRKSESCANIFVLRK